MQKDFVYWHKPNIFYNVYNITFIFENEPIPNFYIILMEMINDFKRRFKRIY